MAEKKNATCPICGEKYYKCLSCKAKMKAQPWKEFTCTSSHYQVYQVLRGYNFGLYTKEEAKSKLENIDLSDLNGFQDSKKKIIKDIMKEDKKIEKIIEPSVEEVVEVVENIETVETVEVVEVETPQSQVSSYIGRRKKSFEKEVSE